MSSRSKKGLMLVDNPKKLFRSLCMLKDQEFDKDTYLPALAGLTRKGSIHEKTRDTYFYSATIFNLIKKVDGKPHIYRATPLLKKICQVYEDPLKKEKYERYLKGLLLSNKDKGFLFKDFLDYTLKPKEIKEIREKFGRFPSKTLIAFCLEAGLIVKYRDSVKSVEHKTEITLREFYESLVEIYNDLSISSERNLKIIYVPIDLIRDMVCLDLGLSSREQFDSLLAEVLETEMGVSIYLHGAAPQVEDEFTGIRIKKKRYAYISIRLTEKD